MQELFVKSLQVVRYSQIAKLTSKDLVESLFLQCLWLRVEYGCRGIGESHEYLVEATLQELITCAAKNIENRFHNRFPASEQKVVNYLEECLWALILCLKLGCEERNEPGWREKGGSNTFSRHVWSQGGLFHLEQTVHPHEEQLEFRQIRVEKLRHLRLYHDCVESFKC